MQCICLIDIILGAIEATQKMLSDPENMNVNRHVTHAMMAINTALAPYQTFSPRQLAKRGENSVLFLQEMLFSIVSTMWVVGAVFAAKGDGKTASSEEIFDNDLYLFQPWSETSSNRG
jgi:hypothetical protein